MKEKDRQSAGTETAGGRHSFQQQDGWQVLRPVARIRSGFTEKFGVPRQSNLADTYAEVVFEPEFAMPEMVRGLEKYAYIWLIWQFSENLGAGWHPTVRPPRLGGNVRMGVFATRSPFRPNPIGLSSVRLEKVEIRDRGVPVLTVRGADLVDGTPVYDIKPYLPYTESHPEATAGFAEHVQGRKLEVRFSSEIENAFGKVLPTELRQELIQILAEDPRPAYQEDAGRIYGMQYRGRNVRFRVEKDILTVLSL